jgi:hypothetical protein
LVRAADPTIGWRRTITLYHSITKKMRAREIMHLINKETQDRQDFVRNKGKGVYEK